MKRFLAISALSLVAACNDGATDNDDPKGGALYVIATAVSDDTSSTTYVAVLDSLDGDELDLSRAREFGGWSDLNVVGDWVFVSSGESPEVTRFSVNERRELVEAGKLSFANYTGDANFYNQTVVSPTKAYLLGENEFIIWNPATLEITGTLPFPAVIAERDGIDPYVALDRGAVVRGNRLYATLAWTDTQELDMLPDSRIIVIDTDADAVVEVLDVPCPDVMVADSDDAGNLYFSNWVYSPGATLLYGDSPACAVRIEAGSNVLDDWRFEYANATGREGAVMAYLGEDRWLYSSFLGDPAAYDPVADDWFDWLFGDTWQLKVVSPAAGTSVDVTGIPRNGGGYYAERFDNTTHLLIPEQGYTGTTIYALDADGAATRKIHANGWSTRLFRLR